jgi:carbonic anhydrase
MGSIEDPVNPSIEKFAIDPWRIPEEILMGHQRCGAIRINALGSHAGTAAFCYGVAVSHRMPRRAAV